MNAPLELTVESGTPRGPRPASWPAPEPAGLLRGGAASRAILRDCFEVFRSTASGIAKLSIDTSNDLFEMDPLVTDGEVWGFRSRRGEWVAKFDDVLRELFERRLAGRRRKGRRVDAEQSLAGLRVMSDVDTRKQDSLARVTKRLLTEAMQEQEALDYRISVLFDEPPSRQIDNPFSPAYLLDAIGLTSRSLYAEARIWRPLMERIVSDFVPAINQTYIQLNRFLAHRGVLPEIGATLRARSELRPADDRALLPLFSRLLNEVHPSLQAWRTLDRNAATAARYRLAPLAVNPYVAAAAATVPPRAPARARTAGAFPELDVRITPPALSPVFDLLDHWQRHDPMTAYLGSDAASAVEIGAKPVNRIPWIHAAIASRLAEEADRSAVDVAGFLFDHILHDPSIPTRLRPVFDGLQVPILKVALSEPAFFTDRKHPARRLIDGLASAAVGADDDDAYGKAFVQLATSVVDAIGVEYVADTDVFERASRTLARFADDQQAQTLRAIQPHIDTCLAAESRDTDRSQVRALVRDKLAGLDVPFDVRAFVGTVWAEYLTQQRQLGDPGRDAYAAAIQTLDDVLWSIAAKERTGQKVRLSRMIPSLVGKLRAGAAAVRVADEKVTRFLDALYELHIAALRPGGVGAGGSPEAQHPIVSAQFAARPIGNVHDFVADLVPGTWLAFDRDGGRAHARLSWLSPLRTAYIFTGRTPSEVTVFTPEELAWEVSAGKATLVLEPVPLFDRAVSGILEYLARQKAMAPAGTADTAPVPPRERQLSLATA